MKISINTKAKESTLVISADPHSIKVLANWMLEMAALMEKRGHNFSHEHINGMAEGWSHKNLDVVISNPKSQQ